MPSFLQIENISKSYGQKVLFENIGFNINEGDKIALIAPNGTGKTSLLRILAGEDKSDSGGKILFLKDISIAFLKQDYEFDPQLSVEQQICRSCTALEGMMPQQQEDFLQRMRELATGFRLDTGKRMGDLSGGEVKRVALTQLLAQDAEFLIMDEPTNHLDIEAIEFLEAFLSRRRCTLLMVTHDRYFLDRVCNTVMELDRGAVYVYKGNYQNYLQKRSERIANYNAETDKVRNLLRRELEWIHATPCARSGKAKYRIDAFHALADRAAQSYTTREVNLEGAAQITRLGTKIINCGTVSYEVDGKCLLKDFDYKFQRYERVGIVGRNGIGKTTFLKLLTGELTPNSGKVERGESLRIGWYRQEGLAFEKDTTVLETVSDTRLLGRFLFPRDMLNTRISKLSGGEKRRLYLLTVLMQDPNLLILDEPTNDLDIVTLNILEEYLLDFKGTLIVVSHDRHFMDRIADHLLVFCGDGAVKDFNGTFSEYRSFIKDYEAAQAAGEKAGKIKVTHVGSAVQGPDTQDAAGQAQKGAAAGQAQKSDNKRKLSYKEQRELDALEKDLPALEEEKVALEQQLSSGALPFDRLTEASERIQQLISEIDAKESRWLELTL